ncbi:MAG: PAS domain S-box protein [Acidobacteria bacterium]|nr:PAS domain S-box protein [Acidobacteriota bacterium]
MEEQLAHPLPVEIIPDRELREEVRQFEYLFNLTNALLATQTVDERLSMSMEGLTAELGFPCAAIALIDRSKASLVVRVAAGFQNNAEISGMEIPLDSAAAGVSVIYSRRPTWIQPDSEYAPFISRFKPSVDLLVVPIVGPRLHSERDAEAKEDITAWIAEQVCTGALYVGCRRQHLSESRFRLLMRFSERIGIAVANAVRLETLSTTLRNLQLERQWVESIMKSVADPIVLTNLDNEILLQNQKAEKLFSGSQQASEGKQRALKMNDLLFSAYLSSAAVESPRVIARDLTLVNPIEGSEIHFEVVSTPARNAQGELIGLVSVFRDVTDLRRANEELAKNFARLEIAETEARRERDRLDLILEHVGQPVVVTDTNGNYILLNKHAQTLFQITEPAQKRSVSAVNANSVKLTSFISGLASQPAKRIHGEIITLTEPTKGTPLPMEITLVEVQDENEQTTAVVCVLHDLSEVRELERRRVEQKLFESQKLAAVGRLAASIAHEVNNPLEAIKNALYLMRSSPDVHSSSKFLDVALKETERVSHIVREMLGFTRHTSGVEWVDVNLLLEETKLLAEKKLEQSSIRILGSFDSQLPFIQARPDQLRQVFLNFLLNAQQAIEEKPGAIKGGVVKIRTRQAGVPGAPFVSIEFVDSGQGISKENLERIFEPFFSTRRKGTGLGLWVSQDIIHRHGGRIEVRSVENKGTTFQILLPVNSPKLKEEESA